MFCYFYRIYLLIINYFHNVAYTPTQYAYITNFDTKLPFSDKITVKFR